MHMTDTIPRQAALDAIVAAGQDECFREGSGYAEGIHDALAAINAIPALDEWQPIETAPKDGTPIDVWVIDVNSAYRKTEIFWNTDTHCWWDNDQYYGQGGPMDGTATHWRPLPKPPLVAALG